jgi:hypothetical protein
MQSFMERPCGISDIGLNDLPHRLESNEGFKNLSSPKKIPQGLLIAAACPVGLMIK